MAHCSGGGIIKSVDADSPAARGGILVGDRLIAVDENTLADVFDWLWFSDGERISVTFVRDEVEQIVALERDADEEWGIAFAEMLFDGIRRCANTCAFCFMDQLPAGLRESLTLKDDDFRLSFYEGNFITLTNLSDADVERIITQQLSPLYVSFHAADPAVRERLIGPHQARALTVLERLVAAGIELHVSIVLVPGINDGAVLDETFAFLAQHRPQVLSVGIVPVAYTRYTSVLAGQPPRSFTDRQAATQVIAQVQTYQFASREQTGETWVHLADEFYLYARAPFPTTEWYDDYPQYENGIGIVHTFVEDIRAHYSELCAGFEALAEGSEALTLVTGELAAEPLLGTLSALKAGGKARLLPVANRFFGGNVNVTGLLSGADIVEAIAYDVAKRSEADATPPATTYIIPWIIFNDDELTLDDYTPQRIAEAAGASVLFVTDDARGMMEALEEVAA